VNFSADFARVWWERWNQVMKAKEFSPSQAPYLRNLGIDYLVVPPPQVPQGIKPEYQNEQFSVFRTESIVESAPTSAVNSAAR
jgi:hypothetical protein